MRVLWRPYLRLSVPAEESVPNPTQLTPKPPALHELGTWMVLWRQDWCMEVTTMKSWTHCDHFVTIQRCEMIPACTGTYNPHTDIDCCWNILQKISLLLRTKHEPSPVLQKGPAGNHKWTIIVHIKDIIWCTRISGSENRSQQEVSELFHVHRASLATHPLLKLIYTQCWHCW